MITVHGSVTEDQVPTDYVADPGTTDPVKLLRERTIQVRLLLDTCDQLDAEVAKRDAVISELVAELATIPTQANHPSPDLTVRPRATQAAIRQC